MADVARATGVDAHFAARELAHRHVRQPLIAVARWDHLHRARQVEPELQRMRGVPTVRHLTVKHTAPGRHPLHVARAQHAVRAGVVAMLERSFQHEGHGLHAAMRMLLEAARRVEPVLRQEKEWRRALPSLVADDTLLVLHLARSAERDDARDAGDRPLRHSIFLPAALTTCRQLASSLAIIAA